mmetsp:Transcript_4217/g.10944  ORF Transcript_4217/g.10944 Transcript_4217/m.10944 type:complete len:86 (-) Transcript_4217:118-375(-)
MLLLPSPSNSKNNAVKKGQEISRSANVASAPSCEVMILINSKHSNTICFISIYTYIHIMSLNFSYFSRGYSKTMNNSRVVDKLFN